MAASEKISVSQFLCPNMKSGAKITRNAKNLYHAKRLILIETEASSAENF
jgi:hypothetical protein